MFELDCAVVELCLAEILVCLGKGRRKLAANYESQLIIKITNQKPHKNPPKPPKQTLALMGQNNPNPNPHKPQQHHLIIQNKNNNNPRWKQYKINQILILTKSYIKKMYIVI